MAKTLKQRSGKYILFLFVLAPIVLLPGASGATLITTAEFQLQDLTTTLSIEIIGNKYIFSFDKSQENGWKISYMSIGYGYDDGGSLVAPTAWGFVGGPEYPNVGGANQEPVGPTFGTTTIFDKEDVSSTQVAVELTDPTSIVTPFYIINDTPLDHLYMWVRAVGPPQELFPGFYYNPETVDDANEDGKIVFPDSNSNHPIPEPGTLLLLSLGLGVWGVFFRRRTRR